MEGEGGIQEEGQKSHLHHRASRSPPNSSDALNMRLRFPIWLKRSRGRREERKRKNECRLEGEVGKGKDGWIEMTMSQKDCRISFKLTV